MWHFWLRPLRQKLSKLLWPSVCLSVLFLHCSFNFIILAQIFKLSSKLSPSSLVQPSLSVSSFFISVFQYHPFGVQFGVKKQQQQILFHRIRIGYLIWWKIKNFLFTWNSRNVGVVEFFLTGSPRPLDNTGVKLTGNLAEFVVLFVLAAFLT